MSKIKNLHAQILSLSDEGMETADIAWHLEIPVGFVIEALMEEDNGYNEGDSFLSDAEADADALASVGWGTDEDYGDFGDDYL